MKALRRFANWLHPDLRVPHVARPSAPPVEPAIAQPLPRGLDYLFGHKAGTTFVVVTSRGVEIPINNSADWTVVDLSELLHDIDVLPELAPDSRRA